MPGEKQISSNVPGAEASEKRPAGQPLELSRLELGRMEWGSDVAAASLRAVGIRYLALVPGSSFRGLHDSLVNFLGNRDPEIVLCLHEGHAVAIADGYGRVKEEPMAVALHANVGLMHACMSIFNAWCNRTPLIVISATGPVDADKRRPWIDWVHTSKDQGALVRDCVKWDDQPASPKAMIEAFLRANQITRTPPFGPVHICLDVSVQESRIEAEIVIPPVSRFQPPAAPEAPSPVVADIVEILRTAQFPLLMIGRGSRRPGDWSTRVRLAELIGGPVLTSIHNPSVFPTGHRLHVLPVCGEKITGDERDLVARADVIISLDWNDLAGYLRAATGAAQTQTPVGATVIHCSLDSQLATGSIMDHQALPAVDVPISAPPDGFAAKLLGALEEATRPVRNLEIPHWLTQVRPAPQRTGQMMNIDQMAAAIADFSAQRKVTLARLPIGWPASACRFEGPLDYMGKDNGAAVGTGPGHTIGTALALKDTEQLVVGVLGDGDYLMGINALWTASNMGVAVMIVVANNRSYYNDEVHQEVVARLRGRPVENKWIGQRLDDPPVDLVAMARAQGFDGEGPLEDPASLAEALARGADIVAAGGRYMIDARIVPGYAQT